MSRLLTLTIGELEGRHGQWALDWLVMDDPKDNAREPYRARLAGAGRHLPQTHLTTDELMSTTRHNTHIDLERLTGIHERRVSVGDEDSYSLAA